MDRYSNLAQTGHNYSLKYRYGLVSKKIEAALFSFLCVVFILLSKLNPTFYTKVSFGFVSCSIPIMRAASAPFNISINLVTNFRQLIQAKKENAELKEELTKLQSFYIKSLNIYQENKELRSALDFVTAKTSSFKVAKIIGRSNQIFNQKMFIDAGKNREIMEGAVVTGLKGVLGRVIEVGDNKSRVMLVGDSNSKIPVVTSKSRDRAILAGNNSSVMDMLYLSKDHKIEVGDWVFTSGDGDTLPPGLLVGVVSKVNGDSISVSMVEDVINANVVTIISY